MRAVIQRVSAASVEVGGEEVASIGRGLLVLLGAGRGDSEEDARRLAAKTAKLRIFEDPEGKMNLSVKDVGGSVLVVSQFTLYGDAARGNRPSFANAANPEEAEPLITEFVKTVAAQGVEVDQGIFGARMAVHMVNDGPVTIIL